MVELTMHAPDTLVVNGIGQSRQQEDKMKIAIRADNSISIVSMPGATPVTDDGGSKFNRAEREILLNYSFERDGIIHSARDTLAFRNRVVDGVNQFDI